MSAFYIRCSHGDTVAFEELDELASYFCENDDASAWEYCLRTRDAFMAWLEEVAPAHRHFITELEIDDRKIEPEVLMSILQCSYDLLESEIGQPEGRVFAENLRDASKGSELAIQWMTMAYRKHRQFGQYFPAPNEIYNDVWMVRFWNTRLPKKEETGEVVQEKHTGTLIMGEYGVGKSLTFNAFCDGREISPIGVNFISTACPVIAVALEDEKAQEHAVVYWKDEAGLLRMISDI